MAGQQSLDERIDQIQHFSQNQEKYRQDRINSKKREAAAKLKAAGQDGILTDVKDIMAAFKGSQVDEIKLNGETIFKMEPPLEKPKTDNAKQASSTPSGLRPPRQF